MTRQIRKYFDTLAPEWDSRSVFDHDKARTILGMIPVPESARILDIACGTGVMIPSLLELAPSLLRAIDLSPEMVKIARQKFGDPRVAITAEDLYAFEERGFDLAVVYNAYPHFLDKARFARLVHDLLAPEGRLLIAHGRSRESINGGHAGECVSPISTPLLPCLNEAERLGGFFRFDVMVDADDLYVLSGTAI